MVYYLPTFDVCGDVSERQRRSKRTVVTQQRMAHYPPQTSALTISHVLCEPTRGFPRQLQIAFGGSIAVQPTCDAFSSS